MYVVTNREYRPDRAEFEMKFGPRPNDPIDELRLAHVTHSGKRFSGHVYEETPEMRAGGAPFPSESLFQEMHARMRAPGGKNLLFFVHGYNTTFREALEAAHDLEHLYQVEVVLFSWPSDGLVHRYKNDKREASRSHGALDRALEKLTIYFERHVDEGNACKKRISLLLHSMGNYLFKFLMKSTLYEGESLIFDNVILAAADVNHHDHVDWVSKIQSRNRIYITINEEDRALGYSRAKFGDRQLARLGQTLYGAKSPKAVYLNFTEASQMGSSHSYFRDVAEKNDKVKKVFQEMFHGGRVEGPLRFDPLSGAYQVQ